MHITILLLLTLVNLSVQDIIEPNNKNQTDVHIIQTNNSGFLITSIVLAGCLFISIIIIVALTLKIRSLRQTNYYIISPF